MAFKSQKEYRPVTKKPNNSSSGNKKKGVEPTIEVSNSNPFDVLNSVDNDVEFGTNGGTSNLGNNVATPSGSSFMNIDNDGEFASNTPIGEKIDKIERQISEGKLKLLDNDENPLVPMGIVESDSKMEVLYDETANLMIPTSGNDRSDKGYGMERITKKRTKNEVKTANQAWNGKDCERQSQIEAEKSIKSKSQQKSQLVKVKVNTDMVKSKESQRRKKNITIGTEIANSLSYIYTRKERKKEKGRNCQVVKMIPQGAILPTLLTYSQGPWVQLV
ncbi:hypothetical protein Tco_0881851 [Tanacetum coccineum]